MNRLDLPQNNRPVDEDPENMNEIAEKVGEQKTALEIKAKEIAENTKQGIETIKENAGHAIEGATDNAKKVGAEAKKKLEEGVSTIKTKVS